MPTIIRNDEPEATHHSMFRSLPEIDLFRDDLDRAHFLDILALARVRFRIHILAFALMLNHVHLLLHRTRIPLSRVMQWVNGTYARYYNLRHQRRGHVLDRRFKSKRVFDVVYQRAATVYIHRNLLVVGTPLEDLGKNPWNGHGALTGERPSPIVSVERALAPWSDFANPCAGYMEQMLAASREYGPFEELFPGGDAVVEEAEMSEPLADVDPEIVMQLLMEEVCSRTGATVGDVRRGSHTQDAAAARAALSWLFEMLLPISRIEIATHLGVSDSAIARAIRRGESEAMRLDLGMEAATLHVLRAARAGRAEPSIITAA